MGSLRNIRSEVKTLREQKYWYKDGFGNISPLGISPMTGGPVFTSTYRADFMHVLFNGDWLNILDAFNWHLYCLETMALLEFSWYDDRHAYDEIITHI